MTCEVTVITPAYNAAKYIEKAILSVLEQSVPCKMLIVNDASKDDTGVIAQKYQELYPDRIRVINKKVNGGVSAARNEAIGKADTRYVAFLDADDWWSQNKIELQLKRMQDANADVCYAGRELMTEDGECTQKIIHVPQSVDYKTLLHGNVIPCSTVMMRREDALRYPMKYDELHEDYIVWLSMLRDNKTFVGIDEPLLKSRMANGGKSRNKWKSAKMTYQVYRHIGIPTYKAIYYFMCYAINGVTKYH